MNIKQRTADKSYRDLMVQRLKQALCSFLICTVFLGLTAFCYIPCEEPQTNNTIAESATVEDQETYIAATDTFSVKTDELTKIYTNAIAEFIKAVFKKNNTTFDTLFFGKHVYGQPDDFPDIELQPTIEKTQIRLVTPEIGQKLQAERKSLVYVNMMGWVESNKAEFVFVVFTNGGEHQYDYFINYITTTSTSKFELDKIELESYLHLNRQKPKRIIIYKDGKYVADE